MKTAITIAAISLAIGAAAWRNGAAAPPPNGLECSTHQEDTLFDDTRRPNLSGTFRFEILSPTQGKYHLVGVQSSPEDFVPLEISGTTYLIGPKDSRPEERVMIDRESGKLHRFQNWSDLHHTNNAGYAKYAETFGDCHPIHIDVNM